MLKIILCGLLTGFTLKAALSEGYDPWLLFALALILSVIILKEKIMDDRVKARR